MATALRGRMSARRGDRVTSPRPACYLACPTAAGVILGTTPVLLRYPQAQNLLEGGRRVRGASGLPVVVSTPAALGPTRQGQRGMTAHSLSMIHHNSLVINSRTHPVRILRHYRSFCCRLLQFLRVPKETPSTSVLYPEPYHPSPGMTSPLAHESGTVHANTGMMAFFAMIKLLL